MSECGHVFKNFFVRVDLNIAIGGGPIVVGLCVLCGRTKEAIEAAAINAAMYEAIKYYFEWYKECSNDDVSLQGKFDKTNVLLEKMSQALSVTAGTEYVDMCRQFQGLYDELGKFKWQIGADKGWTLAVNAIREEIHKLIVANQGGRRGA